MTALLRRLARALLDRCWDGPLAKRCDLGGGE